MIAMNFLATPVALDLLGAGTLLISSDPDRAEGGVDLAALTLAPSEAILVRLDPAG
jgi:hypothetical protein